MSTLAEVSGAHAFAVLEHLEADAEVPVLAGLQAQGDLFVIPEQPDRSDIAALELFPVTVLGLAVIEAVGSGHEHRLFAGEPGTAWFGFLNDGANIGVLQNTAPAFLLHPEHGATGIAPGCYMLRRQREQAEEQRLVAD